MGFLLRDIWHLLAFGRIKSKKVSPHPGVDVVLVLLRISEVVLGTNSFVDCLLINVLYDVLYYNLFCD